MGDMSDQCDRTVAYLIAREQRYPEEAFHFVREGLGFAADRVHGQETEAHRVLYRYLGEEKLDWCDLIDRHASGALPDPVMNAIEEAGGCEKIDRHVNGRQLCWGLRDFAIQRWGMLARTVLESWNVTTSADFGRIVFRFIDFDLMQKRPEDRLEDFENVYSFDEAFDDGALTDTGDHDGVPDVGGA